MALPKIDMPQFNGTLPGSKTSFSYRPYTVKEQKLLMMAVQSQDYDDLVTALYQIIRNCTDQEPDELMPIDVEYIFIRLRAVSSSNVVELSFAPTNCNRDDCPQEIAAGINLDDVEVRESDITLEDHGIRQRAGGDYVVPITDTIGLIMKHRNALTGDEENIVYQSTMAIYTEDEIQNSDEYTFEEFSEFFDSIPGSAMEGIRAFFEAQPKLVCKVSGACQRCKKRFDSELEGFENFLE